MVDPGTRPSDGSDDSGRHDSGEEFASTEIPAALDGERLDRVIAMITGCSRSEAADAVATGRISIDGRVVETRSQNVRAGQVVDVADDPRRVPTPPAPDPDVPIQVVHVDDYLIVVDKFAGQVVHPGAGHQGSTMVSGLLARFPELSEVGEMHRPGIVHRLDKGTSGLMVVARTQASYEHLVGLLAGHDVERRYRTLVWGSVEAAHGTIDAPVGRSRRDPLRMTVATDGRSARTHYEVARRFVEPAEMSELGISLETGRTHQIRVHLTSIGHPVVGDPVYGHRADRLGLDRPFLHAERLSFVHPGSGDDVEFASPLPDDLAAALARLL